MDFWFYLMPVLSYFRKIIFQAITCIKSHLLLTSSMVIIPLSCIILTPKKYENELNQIYITINSRVISIIENTKTYFRLDTILSQVLNFFVMMLLAHILVHIIFICIHIISSVAYSVRRVLHLFKFFNKILRGEKMFFGLASVLILYTHVDFLNHSFHGISLVRILACILFVCLIWKAALLFRLILMLPYIKSNNPRHYNNTLAVCIVYSIIMPLWLPSLNYIIRILNGFHVRDIHLDLIQTKSNSNDSATAMMYSIISCIPVLIHLEMAVKEPLLVYFILS